MSTQRLLLALDEALTKLETVKQRQSEPIAIIGMSCRFPFASDPEAFWRLLRDGVDAVTEIPSSRWDVDAYYDPDPQARGKMYCRYGAFLQQVDHFDSLFFGISPREAMALDPQQRLLLEVSWEALERAGIAPAKLFGSQTGVFVGIGQNDYSDRTSSAVKESIYDSTGNSFAFAAGRVSYFLGAQGPNMAIDTACSSSLVALHLAVASLRQQECELALVGGAHLRLSPNTTITLSRAQALAPDGRCKTFDAAADGFGRGEGCGVMVLKRLSDAVRDGDSVLALIRGSAVNHDGPSSGLTVPNERSQEQLIRQALKNAEIKPADISYLEAHGTGTTLGDPIELSALAAVFAEENRKDRVAPLFIGSVKTNVGHLEAAAGMAGLMKVVLSLQHQEIPPHLHFQQPNPHIPWHELPFVVPTERTPWTLGGGQGRMAGVSSFGMSGTNAHIVLSEAPNATPTRSTSERPWQILALSAKTEQALRDMATQYEKHLRQATTLSLADVCFTANTGRSHFAHRLSLVASSSEEMCQKLASANQDSVHALAVGMARGVAADIERPQVAFLFTGQGSQYVGMAQELYESEPIFRQILTRCDEIVRATGYLQSSLLDVLYPSRQPYQKSKIEIGESLLNETSYTQVALFALEYALAQLWLSWGVTPSVLMGHSVGELVAACVAGIFSLEDGLKLIAARGRLMQASQPGQMAVLFTTKEIVETAIYATASSSRVSIAALNGPQNVVISGESQAIAAVVTYLTDQDVESRRLNVKRAFHSRLMEPILADFLRVARQITYHKPRLSLLSNVTGGPSSAMSTPEYWTRHIMQPVRFANSMETLQQMGVEIFVEIGPKPILLGMGRRCLSGGGGTWLPSLRQSRSNWQQLLESVGELYVCGVPLDWDALERSSASTPRRKVLLPTYPFQRERYWVKQDNAIKPSSRANETGLLSGQAHPLLGQRLSSALAAKNGLILFSGQLSSRAPAYLGDHRAFEQPLLPASAYLEMALAAAATVMQGPLVISDVSILQALMLDNELGDQARTVQLILTPSDDGYRFEIFSNAAEQLSQSEPETGRHSDERWTLHVSGKVTTRQETTEVVTTRGETTSLSARYPKEFPVATLYEELAEQGLHYGPTFRAINALFYADEHPGEAYGQIRLPEALRLDGDFDAYKLHPVLLDACFQAIFLTLREKQTLYLPIGLQRLEFYHPPKGDVWVQVRPQEASRRGEEKGNSTFIADLKLFDERGLMVAEVVGFSAVPASRSALSLSKGHALGVAEWESWLYQVQWHSQALSESNSHPQQESRAGNWLIFAGEKETCPSKQLAESLEQRGAHCLSVSQSERSRFASQEQFLHLIERITADQKPLEGIVYLWDLALGQTSLTKLGGIEGGPQFQDVLQSCGTLLHLVQALIKFESSPATEGTKPPRLFLLTRGTQPVANEPINPWQAPLWALGRVIAQEHPELQCVCLDLAPDGAINTLDAEDEAQALFNELWSRDEEDQIAFHYGKRHVARMARTKSDRLDRLDSVSGLEGSTAPFELRLSEYGLFESFELAPVEPHTQALAAGEVEIQVRAVGLNFRDVLNALGMLKEYAAEALGISKATDVRFGGECSGVITRIGKNVTRFKVGDEVMTAMTTGCLASFITVREEFVALKPQKLSFAEAATLPITFLTALYALRHLADLRPGEKVLIHAAAGGVGQAAVQVAQAVGAEIFATASPGKWEFLKAQGIKHIYNSRTLAFASDIMADTDGQGVDVVLNSLNGEFIAKSLELLAPLARFIEIGKLGIWQEEEVYELRPDVSYHAFDLGEIAPRNPHLITDLFTQLLSDVESGLLLPLPHKIFPIEQASAAFGTMQRAKHMGKIVIRIPEAGAFDSTPLSVDNHASYLITGGLGALGLQVASFLVDEGAGHLILVGRRGATTETAQEAVKKLRARGAQVTVAKADVSNLEEMATLLEEIPTEMPLRGVVHAAGVLDDGVLMQQSIKRFETVLLPKVQGAWSLHTLTQERPLDFFVLFSSAASLMGSASQGNYAAANAFMDALAHHRRGLGLPALSINWGAWAESGMASSQRATERLARSGVASIAPQQGLQILHTLLKRRATQVAVLPINWDQFLTGYSNRPFFAAFRQPSQPAHTTLRQQLESASNSHALLNAHVRAEIGQVLQIHPERIDPRQRLFDLGLDSLMAVELKNRLEVSLEQPLRSTLLFHYPTLEALEDHLASLLGIKPSNLPDASEEITLGMSQEEESADAINDQYENLGYLLPAQQEDQAYEYEDQDDDQDDDSMDDFFALLDQTLDDIESDEELLA